MTDEQFKQLKTRLAWIIFFLFLILLGMWDLSDTIVKEIP